MFSMAALLLGLLLLSRIPVGDSIISDVELIYPRDGDRLYPKFCNDVCSYEVEFMIMIRPSARNDTHTLTARFAGSTSISVSATVAPSATMDIEIDETNTWGKKGQIGGKATWIVPLVTRELFVEINFEIMNQNNVIVNSYPSITMVLMLEYDGVSSNDLLEKDHRVLRTMCRGLPAADCILDFIELGTSSFETIIQRVSMNDTGTDVKIAGYKGISFEAVNYHLQKLPTVEYVLKMNAAISTDDDTRPYANVYFIPPDVITRGGDLKYDYCFLGSSSVDSVHKMLPLYTIRNNLSSRLIQKDTIPRVSISFLFRNYVYEYFSRVNLLKIDIEGMDQKVVHNVIDYHHKLGFDSLQFMPCIIMYEANGLDGINASLDLDPFVRGKDSYLLHRLEAIGYRIVYVWEYGMITWSDNYAINCDCSSEMLVRATGLLFGNNLPPVIHYGDFSGICSAERFLMTSLVSITGS